MLLSPTFRQECMRLNLVDGWKQMASHLAAPPEVNLVWLKGFDGKPHLIPFCS